MGIDLTYPIFLIAPLLCVLLESFKDKFLKLMLYVHIMVVVHIISVI